MSTISFKGILPAKLLSANAVARREQALQEFREGFLPALRRLDGKTYLAVEDCRFGRRTLDERRRAAVEVVTEFARLIPLCPPQTYCRDVAVRLPFFACHFQKGCILDVAHLREKLLGLNLLEDNSITGGQPMFERKFDAGVRKCIAKLAVPMADGDTLRSLMVESGLTSLGDIPLADLRHSVVGAALEARPERLQEVDNIEGFLSLAQRYQIEVQLPEDLNEERVAQHRESMMRARMSAVASNSAGKQAAAAPAAPRKRMRA